MQAVFFGEAVFIRWEVGHVVFDLKEYRCEKDTQTKPDEGNGNDDGNEPGENV